MKEISLQKTSKNSWRGGAFLLCKTLSSLCTKLSFSPQKNRIIHVSNTCKKEITDLLHLHLGCHWYAHGQSWQHLVRLLSLYHTVFSTHQKQSVGENIKSTTEKWTHRHTDTHTPDTKPILNQVHLNWNFFPKGNNSNRALGCLKRLKVATEPGSVQRWQCHLVHMTSIITAFLHWTVYYVTN